MKVWVPSAATRPTREVEAGLREAMRLAAASHT